MQLLLVLPLLNLVSPARAQLLSIGGWMTNHGTAAKSIVTAHSGVSAGSKVHSARPALAVGSRGCAYGRQVHLT